MAVKLTINLEVVDYERARALMAALVEAVADGTKGGDKSKLGFTRGSAPMDLLLAMERPGESAVVRRESASSRVTGTTVVNGDLEPWRGAFDDDGDEDDE